MILLFRSFGDTALGHGGVTIHVFTGIGIGKGSAQQLKSTMPRVALDRVRNCKALMMNRINRCSARMLTTLDAIFRSVCQVNKPFGGQVSKSFWLGTLCRCVIVLVSHYTSFLVDLLCFSHRANGLVIRLHLISFAHLLYTSLFCSATTVGNNRRRSRTILPQSSVCSPPAQDCTRLEGGYYTCRNEIGEKSVDF